METGSIFGSGNEGASQLRNNAVLAQEDFFELLTAQLTAQDPLKPMDSQDFLGQLAQLNTLQSTSTLTEVLTAMAVQQNFASASSMLGKQVRGFTNAGSEVNGVVTNITIASGEVGLVINGTTVPLANILSVSEPTPPPPAP